MSVRTIFLNLIVFLFITVATIHSAEPPKTPQPLRYLFLVEISSDMATLQVPSAQTIHDIILRSFEGEIKPGQLYSTWFYGSRVQTNPPIVWREGHEAAMARYTANLFSGRVFSRLPQRATLGEAAPFIAASPKLTIFLFTDGSHPISGTPFDDAVNSALEKRYSAFQRAEKPFVVTFFASKGKLIDATVTTKPNEAFRIPELDRQDETLAKALEAVRTTPQPKPAAAADLDKALAAVRNAQAQSDAEKARAAVRDALEGKTNSAPAEKLAMQVAPALREPPKEEPPAEQPKSQSTPEKPKEIPSLLVRPPETTPQVVPPSGGPAVESNSTPQTKVTPEEKSVAPKTVEVATQPKPAEKPPETKPTVAPPVETPKPTVVETPKPVATPPKQPVSEPKTGVTEAKPTVTAPKPVVAETKQTNTESKTPTPEPKKIAMATPPPPAEKKSESNTAVAAKPAPPAKPPVQTAAVTPSSHFPWPALIGGLAVIAFGGAIAVLRAKRRAKSPGSIITQALPKNGPRLK